MNSEVDKNELVTSRNVLDMYTVANEFCLFTEKADQYKPEEIVEYYSKICPLLYLKGATLPLTEEDDEYAGERFVVEEEWENVFNTFRAVFAKDDEFFTLPADADEQQPLKASISEHLADIYQDMKDFVLLFQKNLTQSKYSAVADCRNLFISHWGPRLAALLPRLHFMAYGHQAAADSDWEA